MTKPLFTTILLLGGIAALSVSPSLAASKTYDRAAFTGVDIGSSLDARIEIGPIQSIRAETADQVNLDKLHVEVVNGRLRAFMERSVWDLVSFSDPHVAITIVTPSLDALSASAAAEVIASGMTGSKLTVEVSSSADIKVAHIDTQSIAISASSAGTLDLDGACVSGTVQISSGASISGAALECVDLNIEASSGASGVLFASGQVNAQVSSGANIQLAGHPDHVDDEVSSGADVDVLR
ncbi:hypothetical protein VW23_018370 [Devosia insulae DS-56]|uniref:Putative auto-transporter adhesin head GIN domain-containing protein n=1 Tax=Devosia insulae DS-56 TaxID=1116389 RepID=A0A1E5XRC9_9HYPH|nr:DUF2807 domain-containing protein [Devosia insulae]OEO31054.1 hypothetical protein VW23_018370 [Devosia insulae DS-56]